MVITWIYRSNIQPERKSRYQQIFQDNLESSTEKKYYAILRAECDENSFIVTSILECWSLKEELFRYVKNTILIK